MGQYLVEDLNLSNNLPQLLIQPIPNEQISEIWAGSEFSIVLTDITNKLFACGWNEHGNLGIGHHEEEELENNQDSPKIPSPIVRSWKMIKDKDNNMSPLLAHHWEGSLACGGGHVLFLDHN